MGIYLDIDDFDLKKWSIGKFVLLLIYGNDNFTREEIYYEYNNIDNVIRDAIECKQHAIQIDRISDTKIISKLKSTLRVITSYYDIHEFLPPYELISWALERESIQVPKQMIEWKKRQDKKRNIPPSQDWHAHIAANDTKMKQAQAEAAALREENDALKAALEQAQQEGSQGMKWYGLIAVVEQCREEGLTPQKTAARLKDAGASLAVIGGLLHPQGDIADWTQYGKNLLAGRVKKLPW